MWKHVQFAGVYSLVKDRFQNEDDNESLCFIIIKKSFIRYLVKEIRVFKKNCLNSVSQPVYRTP